MRNLLKRNNYMEINTHSKTKNSVNLQIFVTQITIRCSEVLFKIYGLKGTKAYIEPCQTLLKVVD